MVLVLWAVIFLGLLAMAIAADVAAHLQVASDLKWSVSSRGVGMRALADVVDILGNDDSDSYDALHESWADNEARFKEVPYGEGTFSVVYEAEDSTKRYGLTDEGGKINLNEASPQVLSSLFQIAGVTKVEADELGVFIVDWRDENNTMEGNPYGTEACATLSIPSHCKNADFEALEELWWMPGMTSAVYDAVRPELTLYGGSSVNANTARPLALRSLGLSSVAADRLVSWRSTPGNFFEDTSAIIARAPEIGMSEEDRVKLVAVASAGLLGTRSDFYRGEVEAKFGGRTRKAASFVVNRKGEVMWWGE